MRCPYCARRVGDMPDHLRKVVPCRTQHLASLRRDLQYVFYSAKTARDESPPETEWPPKEEK